MMRMNIDMFCCTDWMVGSSELRWRNMHVREDAVLATDLDRGTVATSDAAKLAPVLVTGQLLKRTVQSIFATYP